MVSKKEIEKALASVIDPEIGLSVVELGFIYNIEVRDSKALIEMTLTNPMCPMQGMIAGKVEEAVAKIPGISKVEVKLVFEPPWSPERITAKAREKLGM